MILVSWHCNPGIQIWDKEEEILLIFPPQKYKKICEIDEFYYSISWTSVIKYHEVEDTKKHWVFVSLFITCLSNLLTFFKFNFVPSMNETTKVIRDVC